MGIWRAAIDTGGSESESGEWSRTEEIYQWVRSLQPGPVFGTKGATHVRSLGLKRIRITKIDVLPRSNKPIPGGLELRLLDTSQYKALLHWRMERREGESQRFYLHADTDVDYARQILSEELARDRKGKTYWKQRSKDNHLYVRAKFNPVIVGKVKGVVTIHFIEGGLVKRNYGIDSSNSFSPTSIY